MTVKKILYFEHAVEATKVLINTPVWAIGLDFVHGKENYELLDIIAYSGKTLIAGLIDGRNIEIQNWLSYATEKLIELLQLLTTLFFESEDALTHHPIRVREAVNIVRAELL